MTKDEQWLLEEKYGGVASAAFETDKDRLAKGEPVAFVIGHQPFLDLKIFLDSRPLIPRPETEWWTEQLLSFLSGQNASALPIEKRAQRDGASQSKFSAGNYAVSRSEALTRSPLTFLDLCAGSGAIGCAALAKLPNARVMFAELDPEHAITIEKNIRENNLDASRAEIVTGDLFTPLPGRKFDVIACNPPYIPSERVLEKSVADFEPAKALFSGADGLDLIRQLAKELSNHLTQNGVAWIECDSAHADAAAALFRAENLTAALHTDQYGVPRFMVVSFP